MVQINDIPVFIKARLKKHSSASVKTLVPFLFLEPCQQIVHGAIHALHDLGSDGPFELQIVCLEIL